MLALFLDFLSRQALTAPSAPIACSEAMAAEDGAARWRGDRGSGGRDR
ncbi:MAG: hypothetical protein ACK5FE_01200 [Cyanobacteriota bacterium]|jgi:hypothetical protein